MSSDLSPAPGDAVEHLQDPQAWSRANQALVRKAISEFAHERLLHPRREHSHGPWGEYVLEGDRDSVVYRFRARVLRLEHWDIDPNSISRQEDGAPSPLDALSFIAEFKASLGIPESMLPAYMEEVASTLYSGAYKLAHGIPVSELVDADFQRIEAAMIEGHPAFVANSGRIGFDALDYQAYAPETGEGLHLTWLAAHRSRAEFATVNGLDYETLIERELGNEQVESFHEVLRERGLEPRDYLLIPAHPWQWHNKLASVLAPDIATRHLVCLGPGTDEYQPQQSIRTLFNRSHPDRCYVKTALSVLNMGFMRGLSPYYMRSTPAINHWLSGVIRGDRFLRERGFDILRELATVGYRNARFEAALEGDSPYKKVLAALWRESPVPRLAPRQRLMTMAALLHRDPEGAALLPVLIEASGLDANDWLWRFLECYLKPLLHCFYAHDIAFMPHGENIILVLEGNVPVRAFMKDVGEEVAVFNPYVSLPAPAERIRVEVPEELRILSLFTDVFDCIFRYLAHVLIAEGICTEDEFWGLVAECIRDYQEQYPALGEKFKRYDLFADEFRHSCLNRLQLANHQQLINLADPVGALKFAGTLDNPIASGCGDACMVTPAQRLG